MQQIAFNFDPPKAPPVDSVPVWFKTDLDKKGWSYGHVCVVRNDDGTWAYTTSDNFGGYCGHGGPFHGSYETFDIALETAILRPYCGWLKISQRMNDSCCKENHRVMARKGIEWLEALANDHGISMRTDA